MEIPYDNNKPYRNKFDLIAIEKEVLAKDRSAVLDKRYPNNIMFEEDVLIRNKDQFIDQFLTNEIVSRLLMNDIVNKKIESKIILRTESLNGTIRNISSSTSSYNKKLTDAHNILKNKVDETNTKLSELIVSSMDDINSDINDKIKLLNAEISSIKSDMEHVIGLDEKLKEANEEIRILKESDVKNMKDEISMLNDEIKTIKAANDTNILSIKTEYGQHIEKLINSVNWLLAKCQ
jgi:hypothetical protein